MKFSSYIVASIGVLFFGAGAVFFFVEGAQVASARAVDQSASIYHVVRVLLGAEEETKVSANEMVEVVEPVPYTKLTGKVLQESPESIDLSGKNVVADLTSMQIFLYEDKRLVTVVPIVSIGKPGSAWETPPGQYAINTKVENHFSSFGHVWMPYSMQFFGNFFIHGWPYYPDGTPVSEGYSGGCIRLTTEDAEKMYGFVDVGTTVHVFGTAASSVFVEPGRSYYLLDASSSVPAVTAPSYLVADLDTGEILFQKNVTEKRSIASLTKLMTAVVSLETINQFNTITISQRAVATHGDAGGLRAGDMLMVKDVLYPLLLESSNDAGEVIAEQVGREWFIRNMNKKARSIGLSATSFADPSGLSADNISTAEDVFKLMRYIYDYKTFLLGITQKKTASVDRYVWNNHSRFINDPTYLGGKNGYTSAAVHTLVSLFEVQLSEFETKNIAIVLLGSDNKEEDARALLDYISKNVYYAGEEEIKAQVKLL